MFASRDSYSTTIYSCYNTQSFLRNVALRDFILKYTDSDNTLPIKNSQGRRREKKIKLKRKAEKKCEKEKILNVYIEYKLDYEIV